MSLDNQVRRHARLPLETVNVLRETFQQQALVSEQAQERVRDRRSVLSRVELVRERVEREWVLTEV